MAANPEEIKSRESLARTAISQAFGKSDDEYDVTLFVSHHLAELDSSYWQKHLSTKCPDAHSVLELLILKSRWGGVDDIDIFDFTLPDDVTDYVVSVKFNDSGNIIDIEMES